MVIRMSAAAAASFADAARRAPAATSESARDAVRFQTTRGNPALRRLWAMGRPIRPSPMKLTVGCGTIASGKKEFERVAGGEANSLTQRCRAAHAGTEMGGVLI